MNYELPDGHVVTFGANRSSFADIFFGEGGVPFSHQRSESVETSVHKMTLEAINKIDIDLRENLLSSILVVGGNSLMSGFIERYEKSLFQIAPQVVFSHQTARIKVFASPKPFERNFASWIGGSVLGSTGCFQNMWISKKEYEEIGVSVVKRKCGGF